MKAKGKEKKVEFFVEHLKERATQFRVEKNQQNF